MNELAKAKHDRAERRRSYDRPVALVFQGGGALGSYQAGVYEGIAEAGYLPAWVAGVSIGAINAAIIAGNGPEERLKRLGAFWEKVSWPMAACPTIPSNIGCDPTRDGGAVLSLLFGQPGMFVPRQPLDWLADHGPRGFYDTSPLRATLEELVDFDRINAKDVRFSICAVNVRSGNFVYFDNHLQTIRPEHVMASGALPPGFPAVEVGGEFYWDGGLVSNTPLQYVLEWTPSVSMLAFQVDLFACRGPLPQDLCEVVEREKDIRFSSRTRMGTTSFCAEHDIRHNLRSLLAKLPDSFQDEAEVRFLRSLACPAAIDIVQLIYRPDGPRGPWKDIEFGRPTVLERWAQGLADARLTMEASPWLEPPAPGVGARTFDVLRDREARWVPAPLHTPPGRSGG